MSSFDVLILNNSMTRMPEMTSHNLCCLVVDELLSHGAVVKSGLLSEINSLIFLPRSVMDCLYIG